MKNSIYFLFLSLFISSCSVDNIEEEDLILNQKAGNPHAKFDIPDLSAGEITENSLELIITAGESGATGGLSVRWMALEDYEGSGWDNDLGGHVLLNGKANSEYALASGEEFSFFLEDYITGEGDSWNRVLECGQTYVFIVRAHQDGSTQKSEYSNPVEVSTASCEVDDPCDILDDQYSISLTESEIISIIEGRSSNLIRIYYDMLEDAGAPTGGTYWYDGSNKDVFERLFIYYMANRPSYPDLTVTYTLTDGDCTDSAELTLVVTGP